MDNIIDESDIRDLFESCDFDIDLLVSCDFDSE